MQPLQPSNKCWQTIPTKLTEEASFSTLARGLSHDRSQCTTTKDRSRKRAVMAAPQASSDMTVRTLSDRFFASLGYCMLSRAFSEYWRKETEKSKVLLLDGRFGRSLLCPGRAEKETRGSWPTPWCLLVDRNKLCLDSWRDEKGV